jgi:transcriptional regulator with GAF, ATPase, and Fis domain
LAEFAGQASRLVGSWSRAGAPDLPARALSGLVGEAALRLFGGAVVAFESVAELPAAARERAESFGLRACLLMPVSVEGQVVAALSLAATTGERSWDETLMTRLRLVAELLAGALLRLKAEEQVRGLTERLEAENDYLRRELAGPVAFREIIGESTALRAVLDKVAQVGPTEATVLILGETGTGKELFARAIHETSARAAGPLVKLNCAAIPSTLVESELFGHVEGAFTGATASKTGRFELADGGTIFLDEIGDMEPDLQAKLLRVLQEGEYEPVGSSETRRVDVRVVAATNRDLHGAMSEGRFRPDLYYRLNVFPIELPALRHRERDVLLLAERFVARGNQRLGRNVHLIPAAARSALLAHGWPGNVRELENVIERALVLSPGETLQLDPASLRAVAAPVPGPRFTEGRMRSLADVEREHLESVLEACRWKINGDGAAADQLGLHPSTLRHRMKKHGIERPRD